MTYECFDPVGTEPEELGEACQKLRFVRRSNERWPPMGFTHKKKEGFLSIDDQHRLDGWKGVGLFMKTKQKPPSNLGAVINPRALG